MKTILFVFAVLRTHVVLANQCVTGFDGGDLDTISPFPDGKSQKLALPLHPCGTYSDNSCCPNIGGQEIADAYDHLMNVGGTGGVPIDDERCFQDAKQKHIALKDYLCLYCNPKHLEYMGCCSNPSNDTSVCLDATPKKYGEVGCAAPDAVNTVRLCESYVTKLWGEDGSKYDSCGMMIWVLGPGDTNEDENANPNGILAWGAVDGRSGDDPVVPSVYWEGDAKQFLRDIKPPLLDQFMVHVVPDSAGSCFKGDLVNGNDAGSVSAIAGLATMLLATIVSFIM